MDLETICLNRWQIKNHPGDQGSSIQPDLACSRKLDLVVVVSKADNFISLVYQHWNQILIALLVVFHLDDKHYWAIFRLEISVYLSYELISLLCLQEGFAFLNNARTSHCMQKGGLGLEYKI